MKEIVAGFMSVFKGLDRAYGMFEIRGVSAKGKIDGRAVTKTGEVTPELWEKHLTGEQGLGVIPIMDDGKVWWGCIDIDDHTINLPVLEKMVHTADLPLVVCRSKSGGAHCFVLFKEPADAEEVRVALADWAAYLGHGGCEVFPKQTRLANKNDVGNWLNMPYFDSEATQRYIVKDGSPVLDPAEAVQVFREARIAPADILDIELPINEEVLDKYEGIPPCLELLMTRGFPKGTRNEALFSLGVYCKQRFPDDWASKLEAMNHEYMSPPLSSAEVQTVIKSLNKANKDYFYRCNQPPIAQVCNKPKCSMRAYGVGGSGVSLELSALTKLCTDPPIWTVQVNGRRIQVETAELLMQDKFRFKCFEELNILPNKVSAKNWEATINTLTKNMQVIDDIPKEMSSTGQMIEHILEFIGTCSRTTDKADIAGTQKRLYIDTSLATPIGWFRANQLFLFLERKRYNTMKQNKIYSILRTEMGCKHGGFKVDGKYIACWGIPLDDEDNPVIKERDGE